MLDQDQEGKNSSTPTLRELAMVLFRQQKTFLWVGGVIFLLALVYSIAGTSYRAQLRVLVRRGRFDPPVAAQANAPFDSSRAEVTEEELNSELELLKDDDVLLGVVKSTDLAAHDWLHWLRPHEEAAKRNERAARRLSKKLKVESIKKTNVIAVSYDAAEPEGAATVLRALSSCYLQKHMEVNRPTGQMQFFDRQTEESRKQLDEAKRQLLSFEKKHGVVAAGEERDLILRRISDSEASYRETRAQLAQAEHRVQQLNFDLRQLPARTTTQIRTAENQDLARDLKSKLLELQMKRTELLTKFEPSHRLVQQVDEEIKETEAAIATEKLTPVHDETTDRNNSYEWAEGEAEKVRVEIRGLVAREAEIATQLAGYRATARQLGEEAINQDDLTSSEAMAEANYLLYVKKREEARMGDALDGDRIMNVAIAEQPVAPALPVWPPLGVVLVGFIAALAAGSGAAFAADYLDPSLRTPEEVLNCLEMPVLASLPRGNGGRLSA